MYCDLTSQMYCRAPQVGFCYHDKLTVTSCNDKLSALQTTITNHCETDVCTQFLVELVDICMSIGPNYSIPAACVNMAGGTGCGGNGI